MRRWICDSILCVSLVVFGQAAFAVNECHVMIIKAPNNRPDIVFLNKNQSKIYNLTINQINVVSGNNIMATLQAGLYVIPQPIASGQKYKAAPDTRLKKLTCLRVKTARSGWLLPSVDNVVRQFKGSPNRLAMTLKGLLNKGEQEVTMLMARAGISAPAVAGAVKDAFSGSATVAKRVVTGLRRAGVDVRTAAQAVKSAFGRVASGQDMVKWLNEAGGYSIKVSEVLRDVYGASRAQAQRWLIRARYTSRQITAILNAAYGRGQRSVKDMARRAKRAGRSAVFAARIVKGAGMESVQDIAKSLRSAGYTLNQVSAALKQALNADARQVAQVVKSVFRGSVEAAGTALRGAGYTISQVTEALHTVFGATREQVQRALERAGYSASQIADALNREFGRAQGIARAAAGAAGRAARRGADAASGAVARRMQLGIIFYGTRYDLGKTVDVVPNVAVMADSYRCRQTPVANPVMGVNRPVGIPNTNSPISFTVTGKHLWTATSISGFPRGVQAQITRRGQCGVYVTVRAPRSVRATRGTAVLMVGRRRGISFPYSIGGLTPRTTSSSRSRIGTAAPSGLRIDVRPARYDVQLYRLASSREVVDDQLNVYALLHANSQSFCNGIPTPNTPGHITASQRSITVADIRWGVENVTRTDINTPFQIALYKGSNVVDTKRIQNLAAGQIMSFTYHRPDSRTTVARLSDGYCYHVGRKTDGWNDNPYYFVEVDSQDDLRETYDGPANNRLFLGGR